MKASALIILSILFLGCTKQIFLSKNANNKNREIHIASIDNNVCKKLQGNVILYDIFVDTRETRPWSEYDITSTIDSIQHAIKWLNTKATENDIKLNVSLQYHCNKGKVPIPLDLPQKTLSETIFQKNLYYGLHSIKVWGDKIAVIASKSLPPDTSKMIATKNSLADKERLIARLRDIYKTDNVAVMYFINNYYRNEMSVALNTNFEKEIEFAIVSFKQPTVIAHEFLHLFGAWDLYSTPFDNSHDKNKHKQLAMREFPDEIMAFAYRNIDSLNISPFTKYCIGWDKKLDDKYAEMILGKNLKPVKY